jgi:hypothetical protein
VGAAIVGVVVAIAGCDEKKKESAGADASAKVDAGASASAKADAEAHANANAEADASAGGMPICKVMASENGPSAKADATGWLEVPDKGSFTVRTLETGRELRFEGRGRMKACGDDVALVAEGSAVGLPGSGEAPGAEQWVATACGVARWASGVHRFSAARDACKLQSSLGTAHLYLAEDVTARELTGDGGALSDAMASLIAAGYGKAPPWQRIDAKRLVELSARGPLDGPAAVKSALVACERASKTVQDLAMSMLRGDAGTGSLGDLAAQSVVARGTVRAACAVAAVRVALAGSKPADQTRLDAANARWRSPR